MPYKFCATNCRGNYVGGPKVATFGFPKDDGIRKKWINAINRRNFFPTNKTSKCFEYILIAMK